MIRGIFFDLEGALLVHNQGSGEALSWRIAPGGLKIIRRLYEQGRRLGIFSHQAGEEEILNWLREEGLLQYFEAVLAEPDVRAYQAGCAAVGLEPEECAVVIGGAGEDTARAAGMGAVILLADSTEEIAGETVAAHLADIPDLSILQ